MSWELCKEVAAGLRALYTTNAIEPVNMSLRKTTKNRGSFPGDEALLKLFYLALKNISKKWMMPIRDWKAALNPFTIQFEDRSRNINGFRLHKIQDTPMNNNNQVLYTANLPILSSKLLQIKESGTNCIIRANANMIIIMLLLLTIISFATPAVYAANLLFRSNFGSGISLGSPYNFSTYGAWQAINGTDKETGYTWPVSALGSDFSGVQLITVDPITPSTIRDHIINEIRSVTGPKGSLVNELFQQVKIKGTIGKGVAQAPLVINRPWKVGDINDLYISYWFKHQANLESQLDITVPSANWRTIFAFKTGGYLDTWRGDYRITVYVMKGSDNKLYWATKGDNVANGPFTPTDYWIETNRAVPVPIDKWSKFEVYWHRSSGSDGRYWAAIDGQVIVDHHGPNMGDYNLPITRIFVSNPYSGGHVTVDNHITELEIWDGFPCGDGVSCFDKKAPIVTFGLR